MYKYYAIILNDKEPEIAGPFDAEQSRNQQAQQIVQKTGHSVLFMTIDSEGNVGDVFIEA